MMIYEYVDSWVFLEEACLYNVGYMPISELYYRNVAQGIHKPRSNGNHGGYCMYE
jgi:hypothetical protein